MNTIMTDEDIERVAAAMRLTDKERAVLVQRAKAGEPGARFIIYAKMRREGT